MNVFKTLRGAIVFGLVFLTACILVQSFVGIKLSAGSKERIETMVDSLSTKIYLASDIQMTLLVLSRAEKNAILSVTPSGRKQYLSLISQHKSKVSRLSLQLAPLLDEEGKSLLNSFLIVWEKYEKANETLINQLEDEEINVAISFSQHELRNLSDRALNVIEQLVKKVRKDLEDNKASSLENYSTSMNLQVIITLLALIISIYISTNIVKTLNKNIVVFRDGLVALSDGKLNTTFDESGIREFGELSSYINMHGTKLKRSINGVMEAVEQVAEASDELESVSEHSKRNISKQKNDTDTIMSLMEQVVESSKSMTLVSESTNSETTEAATLAEQGVVTSNQSANSNKTLAQDIVYSVENVNELKVQSHEIGKVMQVIKEIAEQTNLLALNAAIEAARAGESGRGFAVVADEVRALAIRTQESTKEIQDSMELLQSKTDQAVMTLDKNQKQALEAAEQANAAGQAFQQILEKISLLKSMTGTISDTTIIQLHLSEDINRKLHEIGEVTDLNVTASTQILSASRELANVNLALRNNLSCFVC